MALFPRSWWAAQFVHQIDWFRLRDWTCYGQIIPLRQYHVDMWLDWRQDNDMMQAHDDVTTLKCFPHYWPFVKGMHWWIPFKKCHWCRAEMFFCCCCQPEKKLLKKQVRCQWFETSLGSFTITVMWLPWVDGFDTNAQYYHNFSCHLWWGTKLKSFLIRKTMSKLSYIVIPWLLMTWWQCQVQHKENTRIFNILCEPPISMHQEHGVLHLSHFWNTA